MDDSATGRGRVDAVFVLQVAIATALPWVAGRLLGTEQWAWAVGILVGVGVFTWLQFGRPLIWLLPLSALASLLPVLAPRVPAAGGFPAVVLAAVVAVVVVVAGARRPAPTGSAARMAGAVGWALIATGLLTAAVAAVAVRSSDASFAAGQEAAAAAWSPEPWDAPLVGAVPSPSGTVETVASSPLPEASQRPPIATLQFRRPGTEEQPVTNDVLYVGDDTSEATLTRGPGHYPNTSGPGQDGNFAVAGHRTGWGSPFLGLDELAPGDEVLVTDRAGQEHVYVVDESRQVAPDEDWVLGSDPLGTGQPTLTLTTCDPPGTNDLRLIVFATMPLFT